MSGPIVSNFTAMLEQMVAESTEAQVESICDPFDLESRKRYYAQEIESNKPDPQFTPVSMRSDDNFELFDYENDSPNVYHCFRESNQPRDSWRDLVLGNC